MNANKPVVFALIMMIRMAASCKAYYLSKESEEDSSPINAKITMLNCFYVALKRLQVIRFQLFYINQPCSYLLEDIEQNIWIESYLRRFICRVFIDHATYFICLSLMYQNMSIDYLFDIFMSLMFLDHTLEGRSFPLQWVNTEKYPAYNSTLAAVSEYLNSILVRII